MAQVDLDYPSNSYTNKPDKKEEERHYDPIVTKGTVVKKKSALQKFSDVFIAKDIKSVGNYVLKEMFIPGLKRMFLSALEMWLTGKSTSRGSSSSSSSSSGITTVSYRNYYDEPRRRDTTIRESDYADFDRIIFTDRGEAEQVRDQLVDILKRYRVARVSDMFELSKQPAPYTSNRYGWTDLSSAHVVAVRDGYMINLPRAFPLD